MRLPTYIDMRFLSLTCPISNVVCSNELLMKQGICIYLVRYYSDPKLKCSFQKCQKILIRTLQR